MLCLLLALRPDFPNPEIVLAVVVVILAVVAAWFRWPWLGWWERPLARLARHKRLAILVCAVSPLIVRALLLPWFPMPEPRCHDEFSFLLAADTFAHGRLVNPEHPLWVHFESMHILTRPVYVSAFPIAPAAAMAVGQVLFGHPWAGVCLGVALMCGAVCWMLQGWLPPRWALLGALLLILRFGISSYWMNSYYGGAVAAAGGAFVLGALPRMMRKPHWGHAAVMALGLAVLANSRPLEGAVFGLAVAVVLFGWLLKRRGPALRTAVRQVVLPLALLIALTGAGMGYYFWSVTGKPWVAPYILYRNSMATVQHFVWQAPRPQLLYNNNETWFFYSGWEMANYLRARHSLYVHFKHEASFYWRFYLGWLLAVPFVTLPFLWRDRRVRPLLCIAAVFPLALVGQVWDSAHYAAPAAGLAFLLAVMGMRRLRLWRWRRRPFGLCLARILPVACVLLFLMKAGAGASTDPVIDQSAWRWPSPGGVARANILRQLQRSGGRHLVLVRYAVRHDPGDEWVYNGADIDGSQVVWARELDPASNARLLRYFDGRQFWLVEPDLPSPRLIPYRDAPFRPMRFVALGAPGIDALRSPDEVRRKVMEKAGANPETRRTCEAWNSDLTEVTGVFGPDVSQGCSPDGASSQSASFNQWFAWLRGQPQLHF